MADDLYWMEWAADSGNPDDNVFASFEDAPTLAGGLVELLNKLGEADSRNARLQLGEGSWAQLTAALEPGKQGEMDLPNGRLYFGLAQ